MKLIVTFTVLLSAVLISCIPTIRTASGTSFDPNCTPAELCDTARPSDWVSMRTPFPSVTPSPGSRYYHVSPRGNDQNPGTQSLPFQTIGKAVSVATAGTVVLIHAGVYNEVISPLHSGEPGKYITYQNAGDGQVIIDAQDGQRSNCIEIHNKSYLQFIGLTVRGAISSIPRAFPRAGISITDGAHHIILDDITAYDNYIGIMAYGRRTAVSFITVKNGRTVGPNNIGNIHYGIFFYQKVYDSSIVNNHVAYSMPESQSYGIEVSTDYPGAQSDGARRIVIAENEIDHNETQGIHVWNADGVLIRGNHLHNNGATGIQIEDGSENIVIENNLSENNAQTYEFEAGAWVDDARNVVVRNNIFRSNEIGLTISGSDRVIVHDNYLYLNNRGAGDFENTAGLIVGYSARNIFVSQNTFYRNGSRGMQYGQVNFGLYDPSCARITFKNNIVAETANTLDLFHDSCTEFVSDFNDFYNARPLVIQWNRDQVDWERYLEMSGQDRHSLTSIPLFTDPSSFDFSLRSKSPLIDKGTVLAWTTSAGTGTRVSVTNAGYFSDGFGIGTGDSIVIGGSLANIIEIDYASNLLRIDRQVRWEKNDPVSFPFDGAAPDMGAASNP